jgi:hypothetical protein
MSMRFPKLAEEHEEVIQGRCGDGSLMHGTDISSGNR